ncbi:MAG: WGR domain-containing protein [Okeania sp. SIO2F4]|uniref:WGR domain-containing protein n=1 Tax=Okeania sp. SIO2F4 TaxID=2607790 RepID=UPI00142C28C5|nr:WGR domain-containing protein [Okeania sp. SIO2F4]NES05280.1 WGR domain-containing protein [Okeania sp. SIO2F4]
MKVIKKIILHYQDDRSDKIYEVDIFEVKENQHYMVNFNYGRRGSQLRHGIRTDGYVPFAKAEKVFNQVVEEKIKRGYQDVTGISLNSLPKKTEIPSQNHLRKQAIIEHLAREKTNRPLERIIWRAGELKIAEATPMLINFLGTGTDLRDYCIAWSLGCCGGKDALAALIRLYENPATSEFVSRIVFEAILKLSDSEIRAELQKEMIEFLSPELREFARHGTAEKFEEVFNKSLEEGKSFSDIERLYQIDNEYVRPALLNFLRTAPFQENFFQPIRHIFKMAEYRRDPEVFAILTYRFDTENTTGSEVYTKKTRNYLRKRIWRTLEKLGIDNDIEYINLAVSILQQYSDADVMYYRLEKRFYSQLEHRFVNFLVLSHILYTNHSRYSLSSDRLEWKFNGYFERTNKEIKQRGEAFPELWDKQPEILVKLLLESNCHAVHNFAVRVLDRCQSFYPKINIKTLIEFIKKSYEVTVRFGFELAIERYKKIDPDLDLVLASANSILPKAHTAAYRWINKQPNRFLNANFLASLITSQEPDTREFVQTFLSSHSLKEGTAKVLIGKVIAELLTFKQETYWIERVAQDIADILLGCLSYQLKQLGMGVIIDLLQHPLVEIQELGANILENHETPAAELPTNLIESLIESPYPKIREIGIRIFGQLPEDILISSRRDLIIAMAVNSEEDIRSLIEPIIQDLTNKYSDFASQLAEEFIDILLMPEKSEGVHDYLAGLLRDDIPGWQESVSLEKTKELLRAKSDFTQELAGLILKANYRQWAGDFATIEIVKLANYQLVAVRQAAWQIFSENIPRFRSNSQEMLAAVRLLESDWEDSRNFAWEIFQSSFDETDWLPEIMVSICDSVRDDVRVFGRQLVSRYFEDSYGQDYLLKFSEHPSGDMQVFATNFLSDYAADNVERLRDLQPYFISVLCQVNKGRVAKQRVFSFLEQEAEKSEAAARVVADILTRQSVTIAIGDKAKAIEIMLKIHNSYPEVSLPISVKSVSRKEGVGSRE